MLSLDQVTQGFVQSDLENFQNQRFSSLSMQCVPVLASLPVKSFFLLSRWNLPCLIVLDSGVSGISGAISLSLCPGKIPLVDAAAGGCSSVCGPHCCVFSKELQCLSSVSWESCLRSGYPQPLCAGYKQITSGSLLMFADKFKQAFI